MAKIKICGLRREQDIEAVNAALPDYIGFVFARSKRQIDEQQAERLKAKLNPAIKAVGVFVNADPERIINLCHSQVIDLIQLHGDEDEDYLKRLRSRVANKIIKAVRVKEAQDIMKALDFPCDYLLFDAFREGEYGGSGRTFDWSLLPQIPKPYFLAGGINADNIAQALTEHDPYGLDVSSGAETNGWKDPKKIWDIVARVRQFKA
ncbi:MAG: phosphoribosylanthranilate isomerase [Peptococcaceae bacterium]|nr:phosphoribosylanthranilate isomerase [Peptococcaceae bacterium]